MPDGRILQREAITNQYNIVYTGMANLLAPAVGGLYVCECVSVCVCVSV